MTEKNHGTALLDLIAAANDCGFQLELERHAEALIAEHDAAVERAVRAESLAEVAIANSERNKARAEKAEAERGMAIVRADTLGRAFTAVGHDYRDAVARTEKAEEQRDDAIRTAAESARQAAKERTRVELAEVERDQLGQRVIELAGSAVTLSFALDRAEEQRDSAADEAIRLLRERNRARELLTRALHQGRRHAPEYAWEALVEGYAAAVANEPPKEPTP
jgi:hypothetical protein